MVEHEYKNWGYARVASGEKRGQSPSREKEETAMGSLIWRFATFQPSLIAVNDSPFYFRAFPCKQTDCLWLPVNCYLVWDIVLQLSVTCCNYGGVINPENPKNMGLLKVSEKESKKREEALHYYRPGKLFEIFVLSLSRTEISLVRKEEIFWPRI